jgi:hypothetical protein
LVAQSCSSSWCEHSTRPSRSSKKQSIGATWP